METQITKGYVAVAIPTNASIPASVTTLQQNSFNGPLVSAGYYILPGDHIDILVQSTNGTQGVRYTFQDVIVLRVGDSGTSASAAPDVLIVELPRAQVPLLSALVVGDGHEFIVKYVLRPQVERWASSTATVYKPNYQSSGSPNLPSVSQSVVTPGTLDSLFGG